MIRLSGMLLIAVLSLCGWLSLSAQTQESERDAFVHDYHEGLFPLCSACHIGITSGEGPTFSVTVDDCAQCHDGDERDPKNWSPPPARESNLKFEHGLHVQDMEVECATCHVPEEASGRMEIERIRPQACFDCHGIEDHKSPENTCTDCHVSDP